MLRKMIFTALFALALPTACAMVYGQYHGGGCGSGGIGITSGFGYYSHNCGRRITQQDAASLWSDYCFEDCGFSGSDCGCGTGCGTGCGIGCGLLGRKGRGCGSGCGAGGCSGFGWGFGCGSRAGGCRHLGSGLGCCKSRLRGGKCLLGGLKRKFAGIGVFHRHGGGCGASSCYQGCFGYPSQAGCGVDVNPTVCGSTGLGCGSLGCAGHGHRGCCGIGKIFSGFRGIRRASAIDLVEVFKPVLLGITRRNRQRDSARVAVTVVASAVAEVVCLARPSVASVAADMTADTFTIPPATNTQFNLYSSGCGTNACGGSFGYGSGDESALHCDGRRRTNGLFERPVGGGCSS